jgi:hypothetical protein
LRGEYSTLRRKVFGGAKKHAARVAAISTQARAYRWKCIAFYFETDVVRITLFLVSCDSVLSIDAFS